MLAVVIACSAAFEPAAFVAVAASPSVLICQLLRPYSVAQVVTAWAASPGPAALAVAEQMCSSGKDVLTSIVAGYESSIRIGFTTRPSTEKGKPGSFDYWHAFGAATVASRLLDLDREQTLSAFGYAGASAPLAKHKRPSRPLSFIKNNFGEITAAGILGAYYARHGFISPNEPEFDLSVSAIINISQKL